MNSLPWPAPGLVDRNPAVMHLDELLDEAESDPQSPAARPSEESTWANISNTRDSISAGIPTPVSRTRTTPVSPRRSAMTWICPPGSVYLAELLRRLEKICVSRTGSPSTGSGLTIENDSSCSAVSICARVASTAAAITSSRFTADSSQSELCRG